MNGKGRKGIKETEMCKRETVFEGYDFVAIKDSALMQLFLSSFVLGEEFALTRKCCCWLEGCLPDQTGSPAIWFSIMMTKRRHGKYSQVSALTYFLACVFQVGAVLMN